MVYSVNFSVLGNIIVAIGSLSIGLQTGVIMAGKDNRAGDYHKIGCGVWGGCASIVAGILTIMTKNRIQLPYSVPEHYRSYFIILFIMSLLSCLTCFITTLTNGLITGGIVSACRLDESQLFIFLDLFCYGSVAAVVLVLLSIAQLFLHGLVSYYCVETIRHLKLFRKGFDGMRRMKAESTVSAFSVTGKDVTKERRNMANIDENDGEHSADGSSLEMRPSPTSSSGSSNGSGSHNRPAQTISVNSQNPSQFTFPNQSTIK